MEFRIICRIVYLRKLVEAGFSEYEIYYVN